MAVSGNGAEASAAAGTACRLCGEPEMLPVVTLANVPVLCNAFPASRREALAAPRGDVVLAVCPSCSVIANVAFDPDAVAYGPAYENSLHFSPTFQAFTADLCRRLAETYALAGRTVLEIGSGKGEFLTALARTAGCRGVGFDPSYDGESESDAEISFVRGYYPTQPAELDADFVCCRHVLEHVPGPGDLVGGLRAAIGGRDVPVYFEVPDGEYMVRSRAVWDVIYEHPWYFTPASLQRLFATRGFASTAVRSDFGGQYLALEARSAPAPTAPVAPPDDLVRVAQEFGDELRAVVGHWRQRLAEETAGGAPVAVWGIGSKGVTFLNLVAGADTPAVAVDANPRKWGRFVPGTGHEIVGPQALRELRPAVVLVLNPLYRDEVQAALDDLGVRAPAVVVGEAAASARR